MEDGGKAILAGLHGLLAGDGAAVAQGCDWHVSAPVEECEPRAFADALRGALTGLHRRDVLALAGSNRREEGGEWMAAICHYVGNLDAPLWGVPASGRLAMLRAGEFYRVEGGRIVKARIILDLPDLMRQGGRLPFPFSYGTEIAFPPPATQDGICPGADGTASLDLVERMLGDLHVYDPETIGSAGQTGEGGAWADDMLWWGPAGIGSNFRWEGFVKDHRKPFVEAFPDRKGGNHYCRIGAGDYAAVSGWPSMTMTWQRDYLGHGPADGRAMTLRVMDFYRCTGVAGGARIAENWVLLDYVDLFRQMGRDLIAEAAG
ncbi:SnoaL-like protein [Hasllibacter halocynthiae]|uniref:SnoaL-like protein n=1 Tax=Hasllibacter halocynthiae TaxID=595589 RepID=A0A2T0X6M6_9RHOB|nr:ester cyclase [Hasllibacter halocynthiae]PRY94598.1 SnoaL-like protein [Hasllibacter halocynthiae]